MKNELPGRDDLPPGCTLRDIDPNPRPWLDDDEPYHAGDDDDMGPPDGPVLRRHRRPEPDEPERLRCRSCGGIWDEPKLNADGVCPLCVIELNER